jgi:hypothetical protein
MGTEADVALAQNDIAPNRQPASTTLNCRKGNEEIMTFLALIYRDQGDTP